VSAYWTLGAEDRVVAADFTAMQTTLQGFLHEVDMIPILDKMRRWMAALRPGACEPLLDLLRTWVETQVCESPTCFVNGWVLAWPSD
jgi:hypothetical protein